MKTTSAILTGVLIVAVGIQFVRPDRTNPSVDPAKDIVGHPSLPTDVRGVLERSCFDCHSSRTTWPWYSHVAPVSWLVAYDVNEGRKHLNFSEWEGYSAAKQTVKLESVIHEVEEESMPPELYLILHRGAALSPAERERLMEWSEATIDSLVRSFPSVANESIEGDGSYTNLISTLKGASR